MPVPFPHQYSATVSRTFASRATVQAPPRPTLVGGPSSEFDGDAASWSPEHLLLSSLGLCMLTTFEAFAARDGIEVREWNAKLSGSVERSPEGMMFTSIIMSLDMEITGNVGDIDKTIEDSKQYCMVLNSLRVPVVVETNVRTPEAEALERKAS